MAAAAADETVVSVCRDRSGNAARDGSGNGVLVAAAAADLVVVVLCSGGARSDEAGAFMLATVALSATLVLSRFSGASPTVMATSWAACVLLSPCSSIHALNESGAFGAAPGRVGVTSTSHPRPRRLGTCAPGAIPTAGGVDGVLAIAARWVVVVNRSCGVHAAQSAALGGR